MTMKTANTTALVFTFDQTPDEVNASLHGVPRQFFDLIDAQEITCKPTNDSPTYLWSKALTVSNVVITFYCVEPPAPVADLWKDDPDDDTPDYGGAYDGIRVSSDAEPGL